MMKKLELRIELKSDMCCGTGTGDGVRFDTVSSYNQYGLPYIPGKRLKGLLREQAEFLRDCSAIEQTLIDKIFGNGEHAGTLTVNNAELIGANENLRDLEQLFNEEPGLYNPLTVQEVYTVARHSTAMEHGVAKPHSLRTIGAVPSGNIFITYLYLDGGETNEQLELLTKCAKLLRHIGLNRTRGLGEVSCCLTQCSNERETSSNKSVTSSTNRKFVGYKISLVTDLVSEKDYISGSALQGWFAGRLSNELTQEQMDNFLTGIKFGNAYPYKNNTIHFPMPLSYVSEKNKDEYFSQVDGFSKLLGKQYVAAKGFAHFDYAEGSYSYYEVLRCISYHVTTKGQNDLFTLPLLKSGQTFAGCINTTDEFATKLEEIIDKYGGEIRLGGSANIQFGKCNFEFVEPVNFNENLEQAKNGSDCNNKEYVVNLLSDTILYDEFGTNSVALKTLRTEVESLFEPDNGTSIGEIYTGTVTTGGYNGKWKMPRRRFNAFAKGTQVRVQGIPKQLSGFIGMLQTEGFGQFSIQEVSKHVAYKKKCNNKEDKSNSVTDNKLSEWGEGIRKMIDFNQLLQELERAAYSLIESKSNLLKKCSSSSLMRLNATYLSINQSQTELETWESKVRGIFSDGNEHDLCEAIINKFDNSLSDKKMNESRKKQAFLHYLQFILTAIKLWYKNKEKKHV